MLTARLVSSLPTRSDPDSVAFCVLATDDEYECDIALQIHFTLIQAFCFDNDINVVRVNDIARLADLVGADESGEPKDAHCILVTVRLSPSSFLLLLFSLSTHSFTAGESYMHHPPGLDLYLFISFLQRGAESKSVLLLLLQSPSANPWKDPALDKLSLFCEESRSAYDWVPTITLPER